MQTKWTKSYLVLSSKWTKEFGAALFDKDLMPTALKVAALVGSILLVINHGSALVLRKMTRERWLAGLLTYLVDFGVSLPTIYNGSRTDEVQSTDLKTEYDEGMGI